MKQEVFESIVRQSRTPQAQEASIAYLTEHLSRFLKQGERVLICFSEYKEGNLAWLMEQAVQRSGAMPVVWGPDRKWKTLLRQAFSHKVSAIIGAPLIVLGLTKLARQSATPLSIRKVITAGYPCMQWMIDGIVKGFDCEMGGCFTLEQTSVVAGFACGHSWGIHLRSDVYGVEIVDEAGVALPEGEVGEIILYPVNMPELRYPMGEKACLVKQQCSCGSETPRLLELQYGSGTNNELAELGQLLHSWTSILDCRMNRSEYGLEIEVVTFPGEKLPKLPSAAKLVVRPWNPEEDQPFMYIPQ